MNLHTSFLLFLTAFAVHQAHAASPPEQQKKQFQEVKRLLADEKLPEAERLLRKWTEQSPTDVELAVGWANYFVEKSAQPVTIAPGEPPDEKGFRLLDKETNNPVGFIGGPNYDDALLTKALTFLRDAATTHPARIDIWKGATHIQMLARDYGGAFATLEKMADYAKKNSDKLYSGLDQRLDEKPDEAIPAALHSYAMRGFKEETPEGREFLLKIARLAQKLYPQSPYAYNDEAVYYDYLQDDQKVLEALQRAHKARPNDALVILNIAACHKNLKQPDKAREFYKQAIAISDDEELKEAAREELGRLDAE